MSQNLSNSEESWEVRRELETRCLGEESAVRIVSDACPATGRQLPAPGDTKGCDGYSQT